MQIILVSLATWFVAQLVKFLFTALKGRTDLKLFYQSGGMPSAHSATVVALAISLLVTEGYTSPLFGFAAVFAAIVIYDALGVRRSSGEQSVVINTLINTVGNIKPIKEVLGHTPREVGVGMGLGAVTGLLLTFSHWRDQAAFLAERPLPYEFLTYFGVFILMTSVPIALAIYGKLRLRSVPVLRKLRQIVYWSWGGFGLAGLFISLMQFESIPTGEWRLWSLILLAGFSIFQLAYLGFYRSVKTEYRLEAEAKRTARAKERKRKNKAKSKKRK